MLEVQINENDAGQRLDRFLAKTFPNLKKSVLYKAVRNKKIKVNRKRCTFDQKLEPGDSILLFLPPEFLERPEREMTYPKNARPLRVIYEDDQILAVFKPEGLLSQKDQAGEQDDLNGRIVHHLIENGSYDPKTELSFRPAALHRLDRNTSGIVLAAKTASAARTISEAIRDHTLKKSYLAKVEGVPKAGKVRLYLKKEGTMALVSDTPREGYVPAVMDVHPYRTEPDGTWMIADLETGRFHQIRASMAHLGHPVFGDPKYGHGKPGQHQMLQAWKVDLSKTGLQGVPAVIELPEELRIDHQ